MRRIRGRKLEQLSHAEHFRPYVWRDPARCSAERLAELAAHDLHIERMNYLMRGPHRPRGKRYDP